MLLLEKPEKREFMRRFKRVLIVFVLFFAIMILPACGGKVVVNYDLASSGNTMTYSTIINMQETPSKYVNKTFRIKGTIDATTSDLYLYGYDNQSCCSWELKLGTDNTDVDLSKKSSVTVLGKYKKGDSGYYLDVIGLG